MEEFQSLPGILTGSDQHNKAERKTLGGGFNPFQGFLPVLTEGTGPGQDVNNVVSIPSRGENTET